MKSRKCILIRIALHKHFNNVKRKKKKRSKRRLEHRLYLQILQGFGGRPSIDNVIEKYLPSNIMYLLTEENSPLNLNLIKETPSQYEGIYKVPVIFSLIENANKSYEFLKSLTAALAFQRNRKIIIDYKECKKITLEAQVFLDIILKEMIVFYRRCERIPKFSPYVEQIKGNNIVDNNIKKILYSVGSPAIHANKHLKFPEVIPYSLCIHEVEEENVKQIEQKDLDTTALVEYVIACLNRMNKSIAPEKLDDLCTVIGEILINAEEHSTTKFRFSIGYFEEKEIDSVHVGVFQLVILNFGKTIYEKFKDPNCPNQDIVDKMKNLSHSYTQKNFLQKKKFEEETLWTLYALQEGVTSVPTNKYIKRGNGSIRFIESFFNIKGSQDVDNISRLVIQSGCSNITFDGKYNIVEKQIGEESFKIMTFNNSGNIEDKPDNKYVQCVDNYFPGTFISAQILLNEDDLENNNK
ncbi:hypothetical protein AAH119_23655 [Bacteroides thetaiotaomicron]|uniref:hypothetical protein n=1 Tax=Bacteroides thetaiotaomicron TaxID=818 RepID=UPI0039B67EED